MSWQQSAHVSVTGRRRGPSNNRPHPHPWFKFVFGGKKNTRNKEGALLIKVKGHHLTRSRDIIHSRPWHNLQVNEMLGGWWRMWRREGQKCRDRKWEEKLHMWTQLGLYLMSHRTGSGCTSHPSPVSAQQAWMCHWWSLTEVSWRLWEISATDMQPFTSCLLAKISSPAFLKSWRADERQQKGRLKKWRFYQTIIFHRILNHIYLPNSLFSASTGHTCLLTMWLTCQVSLWALF